MLAGLGGPLDYAGALAQLDAARRTAKQLRRPRQHEAGSTQLAAEPPPPGTRPAAGASGDADDEAVWSSFEAFSAALAAEVDRRIASARLRPQPATQRQRPQAPPPAAPPQALDLPASRRPLGSVQQMSATHAGQAADRKRGRSPEGARRACAAAVAAPGSGRGQQLRPAPPPAVASPTSKRRRPPHVAFGTRCSAPRPAGRGIKQACLDAVAAPALLPVQPAPVCKPPAPQPAAASPGPAPQTQAAQTDLLRTLAAAFASGGAPAAQPGTAQRVTGQPGTGHAETQAQEAQKAQVQAGPPSAGQLQHMLRDLTAALQGLQPPSAPPALDAPGCAAAPEPPSGRVEPSCDGSGTLQAALRQHGLDPGLVEDASTLLQVRGAVWEPSTAGQLGGWDSSLGVGPEVSRSISCHPTGCIGSNGGHG